MKLKIPDTALLLYLAVIFLSGCDITPAQREAHYLKLADGFFDQHQYNKARVEYLNAARFAPQDLTLLYRLGLTDEALGNVDNAFADFSAIEQKDAHYRPALLKLAEYYMAAGDYAQAAQRIDIILADNPGDASARALQASKLLRLSQYAEAAKEAQRALASDPNNVLAFAVLAGAYEAQNDPKKAIATIEDAVARNPESQVLLQAQAELYEKQGDLQQATRVYEKLVVLAPSEKTYRLQLAENYTKEKQLDKAEGMMRAAVAALPDDWDMKHRLVLFLADYRDSDAAEREIEAYRAASPRQQEPLDWLVSLYLAQGKVDDATKLLRQVIDQDKDEALWADAMVSMARIHYLKGESGAANNLIAAVLAKQPNNLDAQFLKAHIEADRGDYDLAVIDLRGIIRDRPKSAETYEYLSSLFAKQNHIDLAIETLNQLGEIGPLSITDQIALAQLYAQDGATEKAVQILDKAASADSSDIRAPLLQAQLLEKTGQHQQAIRIYGEQLARHPGNDLIANNFAESVADYGYADKALLEHARTAVEGFAKSSNPLLLDTFGWIYFREKKIADALAIFARASDLEGDHPPQFHYHYGAVLLSAGKRDAAMAELQQAVAKDGDYPGREDAVRLLAGK